MRAQIGQQLELRVERMAAGGAGVGHHEGLAVFVPYAAPGDRLLCRVTEVRRRYARAEIQEVLSPGPDRRAPACPYYGRCGGCTWMHLSHEAQVQARRDILRDALVRIGRVEHLPELEWLASPRAFAYRARARIAVSGNAIGFRAARSHEVIDVERCAVLDPATQKELDALRRGRPEPGTEVEIRGFGSQALGLRVGRASFFQANGALWNAWADVVLEACGEGEVVVELYAGVGFYTVRLESRFKQVIAVERARSARDLGHNTRHARVLRSSAEHFATTELAACAPDVVLLNPPRAGCDVAVIDALRDSEPPRIVYVSCDPATLARDVKRLGERFVVSRAVAIDALPQTPHVESMLVLDSRIGRAIESADEGLSKGG